MRKRGILAPAILLASCAMVQTTSFGATLILKPQVQTGNYATKAVINPYTQASINHLLLKIYTYDGTEHDQGIQKTLLNAQLDNPITFSNLKPNTTYRIKAYAYFTSDESQLISTTDANSYTDVTLTNDDRPTIATLAVKLINKDFNGQATSSIAVNSGGFSPVASESLDAVRVISTLAGNDAATFVDGLGTLASFCSPNGIAVDTQGNVYVADETSHRIRKVYPSGMVITVAGNGNTTPFSDGPGNSATFCYPRGVAVDSQGNLYVGEFGNNRIRKIDTNGVVTTIAGNGSSTPFTDGSGTSATFWGPQGIILDATGNIFVADTGNNRIRKITPTGVVTTVAGNGNASYADGTGTSASFNALVGLAIDAQGNLYVGDTNNNRIRKVTPAGVVTTVAGNGNASYADGTGTAASLNNPRHVAVDAQGNLYVADRSNQRIRKITSTGIVSTIIGNGNASFSDGTGTSATINSPAGIAADAWGNVYISDNQNHRIRRIR